MNTATNGMTAELPVLATIKPKAKTTTKPKAKTTRTTAPKTPKTIADLPAVEAMQNESKLEKEVIWYELDALRKKRVEEEPLHILVYFRTEKQKTSNIRHGRVTFSKFISGKMNDKTKIKFGSLNGKVVFQINDKEGFPNKLGSKMYTKRVVSNCHIAEIIFDRFKLKENQKSYALKLKDLGNDFYLIDEIIK